MTTPNDTSALSARTTDGVSAPVLDGKRKLLLLFLKLLPKNLISRIGGVFASVPWPGPIQRFQIRSFARTFSVNLAEVKAPIESFRTIQDFFVRELKDGARPIDAAADAFVSPCDGAWGASGVVENGQILQVKGRPYSLSRLLGSDDLAKKFEGGMFATLYLSPKDYHRFHTPFAGAFVEASYLPGTLWPVNSVGVLGVDALFAENERISAVMKTADDRVVALVPVGATVVGKVHVTFDTLTTNAGGRRLDRTYPMGEKPTAKGQEFGRFCFGSTVIVVVEKGAVTLDIQPPGTKVVLGTRIGTVH